MWAWFRGGLATLLVVVLVVDGFLAYQAFSGDEDGAGSGPSAVAGGPSHADLEVFEEFGTFAGRISITNPFDHDIDVFVDVDLYEGEQHVGELTGAATLRPHSTSSVELRSVDDLVPYTESRVHLNGWSVGTQSANAT